jgi:DNA-binding PadR family transcriptional regulator
VNTFAGNREPGSFLPLTAVQFEILLSLAETERHGYAIMQEVESRSGLTLLPGTLYRAIGSMLDDGLIEEMDGPGDERRRYYRLSKLGHQVAALEARRVNEQVRAARARKLLRGEA